MPAIHHINDNMKLVITIWDGEPSSQDLHNAFKIYQRDIKSKPEYVEYDELVDFRKIEGFKLRSDGLRILATTASSFDKSEVNCKLAIVVNTTLTYGLARMYQIYRGLNPQKKEIRVFKNKSLALNWLGFDNDRA